MMTPDSSKMNDTRNKRDKNQHIQVFVRVRPINTQEKQGRSPVVVDVPSNREIVVKERPQDKLTKKFTFDKVFGPNSKQIDVYNAVVSPLLEEVLAGYNCTVFAYGQTGTGKTFTMEGICNDSALQWQTDSTAGIIPRTLSHLFDELRTLGGQEYTVRVSFLELYNEELFDLLSPNDDASKIRIYEDTSRKGAIIIHGLEEVTVHSKSEVYKILEKGSEKRQTAATLMNAQSSRSHTVFSITVHIKENTVDGEELLKTGKLNLVDLAGSENVGRSGAVDRRAREAGNINQSLLTLGRVITALVERAPHVPYRESKLTRLLQESLGGRTKTSIIATISPASINIEETLSTLDYAHRAKNITNRPEINQKLSKKALLKEYTEEIERLRRDLLATRERNGVYLAQDNYSAMQNTIEYQSKEIEEKINHIKALEESMQNKEKIFTDLQMEYEIQINVLHETKSQLQSTQSTLKTTKHQLNATEYDRDLQKHLVDKHLSTEQVLLNQAQVLLNVADTATTDTSKLHDKISRKSKVEQENESLSHQFRQDMNQYFQDLVQNVSSRTQSSLSFCAALKDQINFIVSEQEQGINKAIDQISTKLIQQERSVSNDLSTFTNKSHEELTSWILNEVQSAKNLTQLESQALTNLCKEISPKIRELVDLKISENLKSFKTENDNDFKSMLKIIQSNMDILYKKLHSDHDSVINQINKIRTSIDRIDDRQNEMKKNEEQFTEMFAELTKQFENTLKFYNEKKESDQENHLAILKAKDSIRMLNDELGKQNSVNYSENVSMLQESVLNTIMKNSESIRTNIDSNLKKNWDLADGAIIQSKNVIDSLESNINTVQKALANYEKYCEENNSTLQRKFSADKEIILGNIQAYNSMVSNTSSKHTELMEEQKQFIDKNSSDLNAKLVDQSSSLSVWNNSMHTNLHSTYQKIDKFIVEDLRKDVPTGNTPARREFNYPRYLAATSPHERIIKRFREVRRVVETSEDEDDNTMEFLTPKSNLNGDQNSILSPMSEKKKHVTSTPNSERSLRYQLSKCNNLTKSASTSDIPAESIPKLDSTVMSESEIFKGQDNKENGEFLKPSKIKQKRTSKPKYSTRKILASQN